MKGKLNMRSIISPFAEGLLLAFLFYNFVGFVQAGNPPAAFIYLVLFLAWGKIVYININKEED